MATHRIGYASDRHYEIKAKYWDEAWKVWGSKKLRRLKFQIWRRRTSFMDKFVNSFGSTFGKDVVIVHGDAAEKKGGFGRVKGGGVKGPVKELRKRLAKRYPVIVASEYRTSMLCHYCGQEVAHPTRRHDVLKTKSDKSKKLLYKAGSTMYGVSYCHNRSHHHMQGRDRMAAFNIGARFLARQLELDLGPWQFRSARPSAAVDSGSTVLYDVLREHGDVRL